VRDNPLVRPSPAQRTLVSRPRLPGPRDVTRFAPKKSAQSTADRFVSTIAGGAPAAAVS